MSLDPDEILTDAKVYQFKEGGDAAGVTEHLRGVPEWDPVLSGKTVVHERLDGTRYIADGHQRLGLAKRSKAAGQEGVRIDAQVFREADGWTAGEMRKIAALKNIAEGSGTAIDAAKVIREAGLNEPRLKNIPRSSAVMRDGEQLAKLSDPAFSSVVNGTVKPEYAAHVGKMIQGEAEQLAALKALRKYAPKNTDEARSIVEDIREIGFARKREAGIPDDMEQGNLFGDVQEVADLIGERSQIMANAKRKIKEDRALFGKLVSGEGKASEAGNTLNRAANEARLSEDEQILRALESAKYVGAPAEALKRASRGLKEGKSLALSTEEFLEAIRTELGGLGGSGRKSGRPALESAAQAAPRGRSGQVSPAPAGFSPDYDPNELASFLKARSDAGDPLLDDLKSAREMLVSKDAQQRAEGLKKLNTIFSRFNGDQSLARILGDTPKSQKNARNLAGEVMRVIRESGLELPAERSGRIGMDFEPDLPGGKPATGWDSPRPPESIGGRRLTAEEKADWGWMTSAERKEMMGAGKRSAPETGPRVGMDAEQLELGYKVGGEDVQLGQAHTVKDLPVPAIVRFVKETTGSYPNVTDALRALGKKLGGTVRGRVVGRAIQLNPDLFQDVAKLAKVLAHEIGHLPDLVPWAAKGITGGIGDLRKGMRSWLKALPPDVRKELWEASKHWRPIDEARASAQQLRYRKDVEETFADAISMMFNDPDKLQKMAPKFWREFTAQLDKAPKLKQSIADVHAWRSGTLQDLTKELRQQISADMVRGEDLFKALQAEAQQREQSLIYRLHQNWGAVETALIDEGGVWKAWADRIERQGGTIPEHLDPRIHYDAYQAPDGAAFRIAEQANEEIIKPLREAGVDETLAGEWIKNQAIADGHRANVANSRGVTAKEAAEALRQIEKQLTPEQLRAVKDAAKKARAMFFDALELAADSGRLDRATLERLRKHKDSLTPQLELEKLHQNLEDVVSSIETGSFAESSNPLIGMVQQTLAIRNEARRNNARRAMLDFVREFAPEEILAKPRKGTKEFGLYRDGVKESHHVDEYLSGLFDTTSTREAELLGKVLDFFKTDKGTGAFLATWLRYNPAFYLRQFVMDTMKSAGNLATVGLYGKWDPRNIFRVMASYKDAWKPALDYAAKRPNDVISRMIDELAILPADLSLTNQLTGDALANSSQMDLVLAKAGLQKQALDQAGWFRQQAIKLADFATWFGQFATSLPKVAAYQELAKSSKISPGRRAQIVRNHIGQPPGHIRGKLTRSSNRLLTFSNTIIQGFRSEWHLARRPSTRAGVMVRLIKQAVLPKLLLTAAGVGYFGEEVAEMYAAIPDRDKRNSIPIPWGWEEGGEYGRRVRYFNVPLDPLEKLFGAMAYGLANDNGKEAADRLKKIGDTGKDLVPGVNPTLTGGKNLLAAVLGGSPEDDFGRPILSRDEEIAGPGARLSGYFRWQVGEFGVPGQALQAAIWDEELGQKTNWVPAGIPWVNSFFKVSDAGFAEQQRADEMAEDRGKARGRLAYGPNVRELRQQYSRLQGIGPRTLAQEKAWQDLKRWRALYDQQNEWISRLEASGKKEQAKAARAKLEMMSQKYMSRFQATTGKLWK